jgi:FkbM family methyltransferase
MYRHLPELIENNRLFRILFVLRKLLLSKKSMRHYSQYGEDVVIDRFLDIKKKGFYVDVGCFHPVKYNNTYKLYKRGWRGINIDLDAIKIQAFNLWRRRDINLNYAITDLVDGEEIEYYSFGFWTLISTMDEAFAASKGKYKVKRVKARTLNSVLEEHGVEEIDLLNVDAENFDVHVLRSISLERYRPRVIMVECQEKDLERMMNGDTYAHLRNHGYRILNWTGPTFLFGRSEMG